MHVDILDLGAFESLYALIFGRSEVHMLTMGTHDVWSFLTYFPGIQSQLVAVFLLLGSITVY